jgi:hypothetical protein
MIPMVAIHLVEIETTGIANRLVSVMAPGRHPA